MQNHSNVAGLRSSTRLLMALAIVASVVCPARAQTTAPELTAEDYAEILQLYFKYPLALDSGDAEGFANLFTEDGSFGDRVVGREALLAFASREPRTVRHAPLTPIITATPEGARGVVLNLFIDVSQQPAVITRVSQYTDTLVKTTEGWRFKKRVNGTADLTDPEATRSPIAPGN